MSDERESAPQVLPPWHPVGYVYLAWFPDPIAAYKIGHSRNVRARVHSLKQKYNCKVEMRKIYGPHLACEVLEASLHNHFQHRRREQTEFFSLTPKEVDSFETTARAVETYLLPMEIFRLQSLLHQSEAESHEGKGGPADPTS